MDFGALRRNAESHRGPRQRGPLLLKLTPTEGPGGESVDQIPTSVGSKKPVGVEVLTEGVGNEVRSLKMKGRGGIGGKGFFHAMRKTKGVP